MVSQKRLKELYDYNPMGCLDRISLPASRRSSAYKRMNCRDYPKKWIDGKRYFEHRLVWLWHHGSFPPDQLDHINRIRCDNRIENLRACTQVQNIRNTKITKNHSSGVKGVSYVEGLKKPWIIRIIIDTGERLRQAFITLEDAKAAIEKIREKEHGEFCNNG